MKVKRFSVRNQDDNIIVGKFNTTDQVYKTIKDLDHGLCNYYITCNIDDIEVSADDFLKAWKDGERPGDLQMF